MNLMPYLDALYTVLFWKSAGTVLNKMPISNQKE
jgi:hypothetical protein